MKRLIVVACALLCHVCANEVRICDAISGKSPLCVVTTTMPCSEKLSDDSIRTIFDVQHLLFEQHEEYMPGLLGDYNWQSVEIQSALDKVYSEFDTLAIIRNTPKLIVFSENFFSRKIVRQKQEFEILLEQHTSRFEDTIFAINYLCTEQTDVPIAEVDRTLQNIQEYKTIIDYANCTHCIPQITKREQIFTPNSVKQKIYALRNISINTQQILYNFNKKVEMHDDIHNYFQYIKNKIQFANKNKINCQTLENITLYFHNTNIIMQYNKSTYCDEVKDLQIPNTNDYYVYKFGYSIDVIQNSSNFAYTLHNNVSTEICRDLFAAIRKNDVAKNLHIIQSDNINLSKYISNIPQCNFVIHADSACSNIYKYKNRKLQTQDYLFYHNIALQKYCCTIHAFIIN